MSLVVMFVMGASSLKIAQMLLEIARLDASQR